MKLTLLILATVSTAFAVGFGLAWTLRFSTDTSQTGKESLQPNPLELVGTLSALDSAHRPTPFPAVIKGITHTEVLPYSSDTPAHIRILRLIENALNTTLTFMNQEDSPLRGLSRINEASRYFEDFLRDEINKHPDFQCDYPPNKKGDTVRSGYPDLRIIHESSGTVAYLDPKLFASKGRHSSLRSFYFSPSTENLKVRDNALHLLAGIEHDGKDGAWTFTAWNIIDLSRLSVRLKPEFHASNKDLYNATMILSSRKNAPTAATRTQSRNISTHL